jgi:hypothetical protein
MPNPQRVAKKLITVAARYHIFSRATSADPIYLAPNHYCQRKNIAPTMTTATTANAAKIQGMSLRSGGVI